MGRTNPPRSTPGAAPEIAHLAVQEPREAQWFGKDALRTLADAAQVALLYRLAENGGERYARLAALYAHRFLAHESYPAWAMDAPELWMPLPQEA